MNERGKEPTIVYAVRHGETEWNLAGKQQGHLDSPLTELGVRQAEALAEGLEGKCIEFLYSSDLGRAMQTSKAISGRLGLEIRQDVRLRERHLGAMQGITKMEFWKRQPGERIKKDREGPNYRYPAGESVQERFQRNVACVQGLADRHPGRTILVVGHGGVLMSLFYRTLDIPLSEPRRFSLFNASINRFSINGHDWRLDTWGDISHLGGMRALDDN